MSKTMALICCFMGMAGLSCASALVQHGVRSAIHTEDQWRNARRVYLTQALSKEEDMLLRKHLVAYLVQSMPTEEPSSTNAEAYVALLESVGEYLRPVDFEGRNSESGTPGVDHGSVLKAAYPLSSKFLPYLLQHGPEGMAVACMEMVQHVERDPSLREEAKQLRAWRVESRSKDADLYRFSGFVESVEQTVSLAPSGENISELEGAYRERLLRVQAMSSESRMREMGRLLSEKSAFDVAAVWIKFGDFRAAAKAVEPYQGTTAIPHDEVKRLGLVLVWASEGNAQSKEALVTLIEAYRGVMPEVAFALATFGIKQYQERSFYKIRAELGVSLKQLEDAEADAKDWCGEAYSAECEAWMRDLLGSQP